MEDRTQILEQLSRILDSKSFQNSERLRKFLSYVVNETVDGRGDLIKSYSIGIEVLNRPSDFDVSNDGIVRSTANRLRASLDKYYRTEGSNDPILISLPKGRYVPVFTKQSTDFNVESCDDERPSEASAPSYPTDDYDQAPPAAKSKRRLLIYGTAAASLLTAAIFSGLQFVRSHVSANWQSPIILIQKTAPLTNDEQVTHLAGSLPVRLSGAMTFYDVNSVVRTESTSEALNYSTGHSNHQSVYTVTSEVGSDANGISLHWQLVDAPTGVVLWSSRISQKDDVYDIDHFVHVMVHELVGEDAVIRSAERRKLPVEPIPGYVCVTHALNKMTTITAANRAWMSECLTATVAAQPNHAQAWALLAILRVEESIAAANRGQHNEREALLEDGWRSYLNAHRLAPGSWFTLRAKILLEFQKEDFENFRTSASKALAVLPENARERIAIAERLFALGAYEEAETIISAAVGSMTFPQPSDYLYLAASLYRRGENADALDLLKDHPVPDSTFYWSLLAAVACQLDDTATATSAIRSLDDRQPTMRNTLETDLRNRYFRNEFVNQIIGDVEKAADA